MNRADTIAVKYAIKKFWKERSDADLATSLNVPEDEVKQMRAKMGLIPPKGNESLKDFARRYIMEMSEADKKEFIKALPADLLWKMSEGNPHSSEDSTVKHILPTPILSLPPRK